MENVINSDCSVKNIMMGARRKRSSIINQRGQQGGPIFEKKHFRKLLSPLLLVPTFLFYLVLLGSAKTENLMNLIHCFGGHVANKPDINLKTDEELFCIINSSKRYLPYHINAKVNYSRLAN